MVVAFAVGQVQAQRVSVPYEMSFEMTESAELTNWTLNPGTAGAACTDQWVVGNQLRNEGAQGLYISNEGATNIGYGNKPCVQFVYRDFQLADGNYYFTFDYISPNENAVLYYGVTRHNGTGVQITNMQAINNPLTGSVQLPNVGGTPELLAAAATWTTASRQVSVTNNVSDPNRAYRLWFAWVSNSTDSVAGISAAIDNIQITSGNCGRPENLAVNVETCDSVVFSWEGGADRYEVQYRLMGGNWRKRSARNGETSVVLENMEEGNYDFRVRSRCVTTLLDGTIDTLYSPYACINNVNIFCPDKHCINYVAITDTTRAICTYGKTNNSYAEEDSLRSAFQHVGVIDYGWDSNLSRHTVVWDTLATDERTGNQLRMVPQGESASVRLGNWEYGQECEAITYDYYVDPDNSILLVKYAIVLEDPDHEPNANPRFVVQIYDEDGEPLDPMCGKVDLNPSDPTNWNRVGSGYNAAVYKDWSVLGLNLDAYAGQRIKVSVATYDCWYSGHYGYAYFTMGCASAHIKNNSCGESASVEVEAPDGFLYEWSNNINTQTYSDRKINIGPTDPTNWTCTLISKENDKCSFELYVNSEPRYPIADFEVSYEPSNCENRYVFTNKSYIRVNKNGVTTDHYDEPCDYYTWDFGFDGEETEAAQPGVMVFPEEGGTFTVALTAMIGDGTGLCRDTKLMTLEVPALGEYRGRTDTAICAGRYVDFHGQRKFDAGQYTFGGPDPKTGCFIVDTLNLTVVPTSTEILDTITVCYGDVAVYDGHKRTESGDIVIKYENYLGCDSNVVVPIRVMPRIAPEFTIQNMDEDHEFATITLTGSGYSSYTFDEKPTEQTVFDNLESGNYAFSFVNEFGCTFDTVVVIGQGCMRNLVYQRWNDVLSIKGVDYNGGLEFVSFQWYKDEQPIHGANKSYYYAPEGLALDAVYQCKLVAADGSEGMTCPFRATHVGADAARVAPTSVPENGEFVVSVTEDCVITIHDVMGLSYGRYSVHAGDNVITAPAHMGVYVVTVYMSDAQRPFHICVSK